MTTQHEKNPCGPEREPDDQPILQSLVPIAVVIAAGCEPCAEKMVRRALKDGSPRRQILKVIGIVEHVHGLECFRTAVGQDVRERMVKPLARARTTAEEGAAVTMEGAERPCC